MPHQTFPTPDPVTLKVDNAKGRVVVLLSDTTKTEVIVNGPHADDAVVRQDGDTIVVHSPRRTGFLGGGDTALTIDIVAPFASRLDVGLGSAALIANGEFSDARVRSGSGDIKIMAVNGPAVVETGSGSVRLGRVAGDLRVKSGSGSVTVDEAASALSVATGSGDVAVARLGSDTVVRSGSGDLDVGEMVGAITLTTGSGDLHVRNARQGRIRTRGGSGDVLVAVPQGTPVWTDITTTSGQIRSEIVSAGEPEPGTPYVEVVARTHSGDVLLRHS